MFERLRIKQHMEVSSADGQHLGTVDELDGDSVKLTRSDSSDGQHHYFDLDEIGHIKDHRIYLKAGAVPHAIVAEPQPLWDGRQPPLGTAQEHIDPNRYSAAADPNAGAGMSANPPLFGTSSTGGKRAKY